jgi:hypothetical protein
MASAVAGLIVVALAAGSCSRPDTPPPPPPAAPAQVDQGIVDLAFHDCFTGDCDRAHAHLSQVAPDSPLRRSDAFRAVQYRFDADRMLRADVEPDLAQRRAAYQAIADSQGTEPVLRLSAAERVSRLGAGLTGRSREVALNAKADAGEAAPDEAAELLRQSRSKDASDQSHVRAVIEPRIFAGKGSPSDVAMLRTVCKAQGDDKCLGRLAHLMLR